jgi:hypothetical protein
MISSKCTTIAALKGQNSAIRKFLLKESISTQDISLKKETIEDFVVRISSEEYNEKYWKNRNSNGANIFNTIKELKRIIGTAAFFLIQKDRRYHSFKNYLWDKYKDKFIFYLAKLHGICSVKYLLYNVIKEIMNA